MRSDGLNIILSECLFGDTSCYCDTPKMSVPSVKVYDKACRGNLAIGIADAHLERVDVLYKKAL